MSAFAKFESIPEIQRGNLIINLQSYIVTLTGEKISLYPKEFDVLCLLTKYPGWVLSPEQIYDAVWKESVTGCEHLVYNVICQIRRKLKNPDMIQTVIRRGYKFVE